MDLEDVYFVEAAGDAVRGYEVVLEPPVNRVLPVSTERMEELWGREVESGLTKTMDYERTREVLAAFEREGVRYVIFGAVALNLQGLARATLDLDVFIAPEKDNIERLKAALQQVFDDPHVDEIKAEDLLGDYPAVQYVPPRGTFHIDVLTRLGDAYRFEDLASERVDFDGLEVTVATPETLYRMKRSSVRPRDRGDAERLRQRFDLEED